MTAKLKHGITRVKDPKNVLAHFIAVILAITVAMPLLLKVGYDSGYIHTNALAVFILSMIGLYTTSTIYHTLDISPKINKLPRKIGHMMTFILITGTHTPVCIIVLSGKTDWTMLTLVWDIAIVGILINALWITYPRWFLSLTCITMGQVRILTTTKILNSISRVGFMWLLAGGIICTAGGIIYAIKLPFFSSRHRYSSSRETFHLFVVDGSLYHYVMIYRFMA